MTHRTDQTGRDGRGLKPTPISHREFDILGTVPVGVLVLRADASLVYANAAAHSLFAGEGNELTLVDTLCPADGRELHEHLRAGGQFEAIVAAPHCHRQVTASVAERPSDGETDFVVSLTDITALKQATERAEFLAYHDPLTRLGNRTLLQSVWDVLEEKLASNSVEVHAMALDLDRFKEVNDVHGHGMGDLVLRQAANRIQLTVGDAGHVFRFGGDEFFVLVDDVPREVAIDVARRIVEDLRRPFPVMGHDISIGCSVGIASGPIDGAVRDALHRAADLALYEVKRSGRGDVACFDFEQEQILLDRRLSQTDLILALANDGLDLAFRPQFDSQTGALEGAEAAISWTNTRSGRTIDPAEMLVLAEETGLVHLVDLWTVRTAIARFAGMVREGWACPAVAVRISPPTLARDETAGLVARALAEHRLPADQLEVQIAEGAVLAGGGAMSRAIGRLGEIGVRIVIDEFCAGRPDLRYLRSLGVERLKFDRKVAARMLGDGDAEALVASLWTLCQKLGIKLSADGIETAEQLEALRRLGPMRAQGSLFDDACAPALPMAQRCAEEALG